MVVYVVTFFFLGRLQDVYLQTTCLATLANMAPHAHHLSAYASQRLVSLFYMLSRKYAINFLSFMTLHMCHLSCVEGCSLWILCN